MDVNKVIIKNKSFIVLKNLKGITSKNFLTDFVDYFN